MLIAFGVALFFLLAGRSVLSYLGVTMHAFSISGGILVFATAMPIVCSVITADCKLPSAENAVL